MLPRADQFQPPFLTLPETGSQGTRWVDGMMLTAEAYAMEGWHVVDVYTLEGSDEQHWAWQAELEGLRAYSRLLAQRRADARASAVRRTEEDASFRLYVDAHEDAMPQGYGRAR